MNSFRMLVASAAVAIASAATTTEAQVVYYQTFRPVVAAPVYATPIMAPAYVTNYTPAGNYAAVTAYSPPMMASPSAIAVTSAYAPAYGPMPVTSYYAPTVVNYAPVPTVAFSPVMTPVTAFYAPTGYVAPLYRRGPFGALRPVRTSYYMPY